MLPTLDNGMAKKKKSRYQEEELNDFQEGVFDSFREIIPIRTTPTFDITDKFKNVAQRLAYSVYEQHDIIFLLGPAGTGKSHLACMFAINELIRDTKSRIVLTRPIVEAGENLGYLPGTFSEKTDPYMLPLYDCIRKMIPNGGILADQIQKNSEVAPLAYMRGRAEPLDNLLPTPKGFVRMGDIRVGDKVFGSDGKTINVTGVFPQGKKKIFRVCFTDGSEVLCSEDHLWNTQTRSEKRHRKGFTTKTTNEIASSVKAANANNHEIPVLSSSVEIDKKEVLLDPYLLGVLLGDGCFSTSASVTVTNIDEDILIETIDRLPSGVKLAKTKGIEARLSVKRGSKNPIKTALKKFGLYGKKSWEKFIPEEYIWNTEEVRLGVLQGLLDTDGWSVFHRSGKTRIQYCTTSEKLARQVVWLVQSLGGVAYMRTREYSENDEHFLGGHVVAHRRNSFVLDIVLPKEIKPFRCERKSKRFGNPVRIKRLISNVEPVDEMECQCISVDAKDHLYLTGNFVVTHNTFDGSVCILDEAQNCTWGQLLLFLTRLGENSKMIVTGDPFQSDIGRDSALMDVVHRLEGLEGVGMVKFTEEHIVRHRLVGQIIKRLQRNS
jgi:phosphate starvation-inducible PhoH-like protein